MGTTRYSMRDDELTSKIIGCFLTTYNELGFGLPETVYSAALGILFNDLGLDARREHGFDVMFRNMKVGAFRLDYLVEDTVVLELKAGHQLPPGSRAQVLTYLRAAKKNVGLVLFYGPSPEVERVVI